MKWQSILALAIAVVALGQHNANADLVLSTYGGVETVYDTEARRYWIRDLTMFNSRTYDEQITDIAALGGSPGVDGPWHMATTSDMEELWSYEFTDITAYFLPTTLRYQEPYPGNEQDYWYARYDEGHRAGYHRIAIIRTDDPAPPIGWPLGVFEMPDSSNDLYFGAWVASEVIPVPVPSALLVGGIGLSMAGWKLRRRRTS